ncbi:MAG: hypothetical protein B7Z55_05330, partial [Planctomycetales bacterium 12-60-4]
MKSPLWSVAQGRKADPRDPDWNEVLPMSMPGPVAVLLAASCAILSGCSQSEMTSEPALMPIVSAAEEKPVAAAELPASTRTGEDWPQFLGLRDTGVSGETGLLDAWPDAGPPMLWNRQLGEGYAPPSVRGERV